MDSKNVSNDLLIFEIPDNWIIDLDQSKLGATQRRRDDRCEVQG